MVTVLQPSLDVTVGEIKSLPMRMLHSSQCMYVLLLRGYFAVLVFFPGQSSQQHLPLLQPPCSGGCTMACSAPSCASKVNTSLASPALPPRACKESICVHPDLRPKIHPKSLVMSHIQLGCLALILLIAIPFWQRSCVRSLTASPMSSLLF